MNELQILGAGRDLFLIACTGLFSAFIGSQIAKGIVKPMVAARWALLIVVTVLLIAALFSLNGRPGRFCAVPSVPATCGDVR